jgi:LPXTG-motif cell wall-anchored protein
VVVLIDGEVLASQAISLAAATGAGTAAGAGSGALAATGADGIPFALVGGALALVLAGAAVTVVRRRRSTV